MAIVLAIEPDLRQAAILKRIVKEKVKADIVVVDSRDAALDAIRRGVPDVLLLSALMSPRDEDELIQHLRSLADAEHLQTHTIPQLSSSLEDHAPSKARGLLKAFRRKKEPEAPAAGCDPDLFAEEIRTYVKYATEKKEERRAIAESGRLAADAGTCVPAIARSGSQAPAAPTSSWDDPFAWNPSPAPAPATGTPRPAEAAPDPWATDYRPAGVLTSQLPTANSQLPSEETEVTETEVTETEVAEAEVAEPVAAEPVAAEPVAAEPVAAAPEEEPAAPVLVSAPEPEAVLVAQPEPEPEPVVSLETEPEPEQHELSTANSQLPMEEAENAEAIHIAPEPEPAPVHAPRSLGPLATWVRFEVAPSKNAPQTTNDELRELMAHLALPPHVAGVAYARGCRIRRVRVPGGRERRKGHVPGPVILSRRQLAAQRDATP